MIRLPRSKYYRMKEWKDRRKEFLAINPYCEICGANATEVHYFLSILLEQFRERTSLKSRLLLDSKILRLFSQSILVESRLKISSNFIEIVNKIGLFRVLFFYIEKSKKLLIFNLYYINIIYI